MNASILRKYSSATSAFYLSYAASSVAREVRQGRTAPGGNQEGATKMGVKFKKMEFLNLLSCVCLRSLVPVFNCC